VVLKLSERPGVFMYIIESHFTSQNGDLFDWSDRMDVSYLGWKGSEYHGQCEVRYTVHVQWHVQWHSEILEYG